MQVDPINNKPANEYMSDGINVAQKTTRNGAWVLSRKLFVNLLRLGTVAVLARYLEPAEFGLVALANVILQFIVFIQEGAGPANYVIYDREVGWESRANSAFWLNCTISLFQFVVFALAIPIVTRIYAIPDLPILLAVLLIVFFTAQFGHIPTAVVKKSLNYRPLVLRDVVIDVISSTLSILMAVMHQGVWSLVIPQLIAEVVRLIATLYVSKWTPNLKLGMQNWPVIWRYSAPMIGSNLLLFIIRDGDTLLVGKVLGSSSLGFYNVAWQLSNLVGRNVSAVVFDLGLSALATMKSNLASLQNAFMRLQRFLATITMPLLLGMFVVSDDLVLLIYGPSWNPVVLLLRIFIVFTTIRTVTATVSIVFNVTGRTEIGFKYNLAFVPFYLVAILVGSNWGLVGVALAVTIVRVIGALLAYVIAGRLLELTAYQALKPMIPVTVLATLMALGVWFTKILLNSLEMPLAARLIICILEGGVLYLIGLFFFERKAFSEFVKIVTVFLPSLSPKLTFLKLEHPNG